MFGKSSNVKRSRKFGFLSRISSKSGRKLIQRQRRKGRAILGSVHNRKRNS